MDRTIVYHGSMAIVGFGIVATSIGPLLEPPGSYLPRVVAIVGGGVLCATSGYALAAGETADVSATTTYLVVLAAVLSTVGVALTYLG